MKLETATKKLRVLNRQFENASYTDSLTAMYNRRYFNLIYERELKKAKRLNSYITFMMLDIDFFKQYNDKYGHIGGDNVLKSVAKALKSTLRRPTDYIFRLGGEEFGVLLTKTNKVDSSIIAAKICESVRGKKIEHELSKVSEYLTISVGVVCCKADKNLNDEMLISKADEMLYRAKGEGRDRYLITTEIKTLSDPV